MSPVGAIAEFLEKARRPGLLGLAGRAIQRNCAADLRSYFRELGTRITAMKLEELAHIERSISAETARHAVAMRMHNLLRSRRPLLLGLLHTHISSAIRAANAIHTLAEAADDSPQVPGMTAEVAAAYAELHAGEAVAGLDKTTQQAVADAVATGISDRLGVDGTARLIQGVVDGMSSSRAFTIASTEMNDAMSQAFLRKLVANDVEYKQWITGPDPCEACIENEDAGAIPVDENFPSGDDAPPAHPNCVCAVAGARGLGFGEAEKKPHLVEVKGWPTAPAPQPAPLPKGDKGEPGEPGTPGRDGKDGKDGRAGVDGRDGAAGADGRAGVDGRDGAAGAAGRDGVDGRDGKDGRDGARGETGPQGPLPAREAVAEAVAQGIAEVFSEAGKPGKRSAKDPFGLAKGQVNLNPKGKNFVWSTTPGPKGDTGATGAQGMQGWSGLDGAQWYQGAGAPVALHHDGDFYLNKTNGDVYEQVSGSWGSPVGNLMGPPQMPSLNFHLVAKHSDNANQIATGSGVLTGVNAGGAGSSSTVFPVFVKLYDSNGAPNLTTAKPICVAAVQMGLQSPDPVPSGGIAYSAGLYLLIVNGIQDTDDTPVASGDCNVDVFYHS